MLSGHWSHQILQDKLISGQTGLFWENPEHCRKCCCWLRKGFASFCFSAELGASSLRKRVWSFFNILSLQWAISGFYYQLWSRALGVTKNFIAPLPEGVVVLSALATVQPEQFHCAQHLWQLSSARSSIIPFNTDHGTGSQVFEMLFITGWAAEQWLCNGRQLAEPLRASVSHGVNKEGVYWSHRLCSNQLIFDVWNCLNPRSIKSQQQTCCTPYIPQFPCYASHTHTVITACQEVVDLFEWKAVHQHKLLLLTTTDLLYFLVKPMDPI